ncbi:MAG: DUF5808 domain-containing protein [Actinomycetota bacterium]|nr:DUF5808 domain-containing protein [Actinomycetota bacterium]
MSDAPEGRAEPDRDAVPLPQGEFHGVPFDFRKPSLRRAKSRWWNPGDPRVFTPKAFGAGWDINFYWLTHPRSYLHRDR